MHISTAHVWYGWYAYVKNTHINIINVLFVQYILFVSVVSSIDVYSFLLYIGLLIHWWMKQAVLKEGGL